MSGLLTSLLKLPLSVASPAPAVADPPATGTKKVILVGDEQINVMPYILTAYRSLLVKNEVPASQRLPMKNLGIFNAMEEILGQAVKPGEESREHVVINMGDCTDAATTEELNRCLQVFDARATRKALLLKLFLTGNHEVSFAGVEDAGIAGGLIGWLLGLGGERNFREDIHGREAGGVANILDKERLIGMVARELFGRGPEPVVIKSTDQNGYMLRGGRRGGWSDRSRVYSHYWREEEEGEIWTSTVYHPDGGEKPQQKWSSIAAFKLDELRTPSGSHPIYIVGIDTEDNMTDPIQGGSLQGSVASIQEARLQAFKEEKKRENPNAMFIEVGHRVPTNIAEPQSPPLVGLLLKPLSLAESVLKPFLSDPSVVAVIGAHHHRRGFVANLCDPDLRVGPEKQLDRYCSAEERGPLPQIVVPSTMDYPNELMTLEYGVDPSDPDKIVFRFKYQGIDPGRIPGVDQEILKEDYEPLRPHLLTYLEHLRHIREPRSRKRAERFTPFWQRLDLMVNLDRGLQWGEQEGNDEIIVHDAIPGMVAQSQLVLRALLMGIKRTLLKAGLKKEALQLEQTFRPTLDELDKYYDDITGVGDKKVTGHADAHRIERLGDGISDVTKEINKAMETRMEEAAGTQIARDLEDISHLVEGLKYFTDDYKHWLIHYAENRRTVRRASELIDEANLFGKPGFRTIWDHIGDPQEGSPMYALNLLLFLESSRLEFKYETETKEGKIPADFFEGGRGLDVPDEIVLEVDTRSGARRVVGKRLPREEIKKRLGWWDELTTRLPEPEKKSLWQKVADSFSGGEGMAGHWQLYLGFSLGRGKTFDGAVDLFPPQPFAPKGGNRGLSLATGYQWHLLNDWSLPRLNASARGGIDMNWQARNFETQFGPELKETFHVELPVRAALTLGDPWGWAEIGGLALGGAAYRQFDRLEDRRFRGMYGYGFTLGAFENSVMIEGSRRLYPGEPGEWHFGLNFDLLRFPDVLDEIGHRGPSYLPGR